MVLRLSDLGSMKPRVLLRDQKDDRDDDFRCVDDVFHTNCREPDDCQRRPRGIHDIDQTLHKTQDKFPLLRLPAKLRLQIYKLTFEEVTIHVNKPRLKKDVLGSYASIRAILYTCRQVYAEANTLMLSLCIFKPSFLALRFLSSSNLCSTGFGNIRVCRLTRDNAQAIIDGKCKDTDLSSNFPSLQRLFVEDWDGSRGMTEIEGVSVFRRAFGNPNLRVGFAEKC